MMVATTLMIHTLQARMLGAFGLLLGAPQGFLHDSAEIQRMHSRGHPGSMQPMLPSLIQTIGSCAQLRQTSSVLSGWIIVQSG